jgi:hypothetical protein
MAQRGISAGAWYGIAFGTALCLEFGGLALTRVTHMPLPLWIGVLLAVGAGLWFAGRAWRRLDETAREAQKSAMFWGGSFGLLAALIVTMTMPFAREAWHGLFAYLDAHRGLYPLHAFTFIAGVLFAALMAVLGFLIAWAAWWARAR